jgi:zinc transport system substrate-binding protein
MKFLKIVFIIYVNISLSLAQEVQTQKPVLKNSASPFFVASINPVYQILLAITHDKNNSSLIINPAICEHDYQLKKSDITKILKADLIFYIDDDLERNFLKLMKKEKSYKISAISGIKILNRRDDITKIDPHLWLNPQNAVKIAEFMTKKICEIYPLNCQQYHQNLAKFKEKILKTEQLIRKKLAKIEDKDYIFYHDGYQYFEDYFNLRPQKMIFYNQDNLSVKDLRQFNLLLKSNKVQCIFGDVHDTKNSAKRLAQNYKIKFSTLNLSGQNDNYNDLLMNLTDKITQCLH